MPTNLKAMFARHRETLAYLIFGVLTVVVNTVAYLGLQIPLGSDLAANTIAFLIAVQFAYYTNTRYVFCQPFTKKNFLQFWGMRIGTIFIDNLGLMLLLSLGSGRVLAKSVVNAVIIVLNYLFSKFIIYRKGKNQ